MSSYTIFLDVRKSQERQASKKFQPAKTSVFPRSSPLGKFRAKRTQRRRVRGNGCFGRLQMFRKFQISNRVPNRYFQKIDVGWPRMVALQGKLKNVKAEICITWSCSSGFVVFRDTNAHKTFCNNLLFPVSISCFCFVICLNGWNVLGKNK